MSDNNNVHFRAEVTIEEGKVEEYKKLVQDMSRAVEANEPDTINYQFYLNKAETECIVWETYASSEAVFAHINGIASQTILLRFIMSKISRLDVYGNPGEELQKGAEEYWSTDLQSICWIQSLTVWHYLLDLAILMNQLSYNHLGVDR